MSRSNNDTLRPAFLITIDTEGDDLWSRPSTITTRNAEFLPRFQTLCEAYSLKPTYLTNWEMVNSPAFQAFGKDVIARNTAEIGMHLHAWNSPPLTPLTADDERYQPFLIDYPEERMREKILMMTERLEQAFGEKMISHRAGRWSFDERYARLLVGQGYKVDCSVTPHVSWRSEPGDPTGPGGTDFSSCPDKAYFLDLNDIRRIGSSPLLEIPVTIYPGEYAAPIERARRLLGKHRIGKRGMQYLFPTSLWIRPDGHNRKTLLHILHRVSAERRDYVEFMLHSSELMPGGSPRFRTERSIAKLYADMEALFSAARDRFEGLTLAEYHRRFTRTADGL